ncbi:MAG: 5-formyltetrahydrofolate cyclo-ligase [Oscillospiraceae bacterium]
MQVLKKRLRRELKAKRAAMDLQAKSAADERVFRQLIPYVEKASAVFCYVSTEIEVDTRRLLRFCFERGIPVAVPVSGDTELTFCRIHSFDDLAQGRYGILEPVVKTPVQPDENTLCVVPALCADGEGLRLGYGKGYYDRFLSGFNGTSVIVCYEAFRMEVPTEPHDKRADITLFG